MVLAKHGLVVWGDTAEEAYRRTIEVINRAVEFVNARTEGRSASTAPPASPPTELPARRAARVRGAVSSERSKVLVVDTSPRALKFVCSRAAPELVTVGAACPDHLVHTKRLPLWIPFDPACEDVDDAAARIRERAAAYRDDYRAYVERRRTEPADPDARVVLIQHVGLVGVAPTTKAARLSRDLTTARSR